MSNINNFRFINQSSGLFFSNLSKSMSKSNPSLISNSSTYFKQLLNELNLKSNLRFNLMTSRCFSDAVSKGDTGPSFTNDGKSKFYAPYVFEEVTAPSGGGPLYWNTRKFLMNFKRRLLLRARERRWNWDIGRAAFSGVPKLSYDPKMNQWVTLMDNEEWGGVGGRFWIFFSNNVLFNFLLALLLYFFWYRIVVNNKHNVLARWRNREEEEE